MITDYTTIKTSLYILKISDSYDIFKSSESCFFKPMSILIGEMHLKTVIPQSLLVMLLSVHFMSVYEQAIHLRLWVTLVLAWNFHYTRIWFLFSWSNCRVGVWFHTFRLTLVKFYEYPAWYFLTKFANLPHSLTDIDILFSPRMSQKYLYHYNNILCFIEVLIFLLDITKE